ncbi:MAG: penicillin-binding protein [Agathobaculum sp.]|uniref:penicillin-binding transpeptidase domain-containing protein n=1 Tax=Agathobaculum sp. TaxID=2048138 RepID=UPI0025C18EAB|nr:penicillin-binding transpeptidase domain-containing protein [Agathobaculum sp.]MCI7126111.1 penicillin-binding protein [Agathobaculum sp.]MDY3712295.1 penicillin-binding transpeptidase domain-containing protein [Agathobaculum sp.]
MRKIEKRGVFCLLLAALLGLGLAVFCFRFVADGGDWASYPYNRHLYDNAGRLKGGVILDRDGDVLSKPAAGGEGREYYPDSDVRRATLHVVGDQAGNIGSGAQTAFADKLSGYNLLTGAYSPLGSGNYLYLTIDAYLNNIAYQALGGKNGTVGVYNYKTGEILCMVSTSTFDPANPPTIDPDDPAWDGVYVNRLMMANSIPGSIFKVVTLSAAIENIPDLYARSWHCTGSVEIGGDAVTCPFAHGEMDIEDALANSCNGVFGQLAVELGAETMQKYTDKAGLTTSIKVDGISTSKGSFRFDGNDNQLAWAGVGQDQDALCPMSMMLYMGAIGSGGKAAMPRLISKTMTEYGLPTGYYFARKSPKLIERDTADDIADMMHNNVIETYGKERFPGMDICAKSGTAEVGAGKTPNAWFTGFLRDPATPYAFIVLVENGGGGSSVAGTVASKVLTAALEKRY